MRRTLIPPTRTLILHTSPFCRFHSHAVAGDDAYRRRTEPQSFQKRNYDEENRSVKVTVWWDFENCQVPAGIHVERVANRISVALRSTGIKGPITITAFGDVAQMSRATQEALTSTGVCLNHVPHRGKNSSDRSFMADLVYWVTQNPPPAHFFLISSDKDFANILHRLRMSNYNILLASNDIATGVLCSAATIMWPWTELVRGENVTTKHFNHPPDGFYGSWYGHYKGVLDDPFLGSERCAIFQAEESMESISETKIRPVPRVVVNGIRNVLHSYPEGMSISELRGELGRRNIALDKDLYGHKKFSSLLASMPSIVKFMPSSSSNSQPLVIDKRLVDSVKTNSKPSIEPAEVRSKSAKEAPTSKVEKTGTLAWDEKALPVVPPNTVGVSAVVPPAIDMHTPVHLNANMRTPTPVDDAVAEGGSQTAELSRNAESEEGFFGRIWTTLLGRKNDDPSGKKAIMPKVCSTSRAEPVKVDILEELKSKEKSSSLKDISSNMPSSLNALGIDKSIPEEKTTVQSEEHNETSNLKKGFFGQLADWWQSWKSGTKDQRDISVEKHQEADVTAARFNGLGPSSYNSETHELFLRPQFWDALESFLVTSKGADLILKSCTRDQLARKLQKEGPSVLNNLKGCHISKLVELLISEKRWVEESASQTFPFKLTLTAKRKGAPSNFQGSNGLSSLFSGRTSNGRVEAKPPQNLHELKTWYQRTFNDTEDIKPEEFQKLFESDFNEKLVCSLYGYPTIRSLLFACSADKNSNQGMKDKAKSPNKGEVLSDCHKLVMELLNENPNGFNMSNFRPAFFQKYGYVLDCKMLGYSKLASLLQIMPGVKIEASCVMPENPSNLEDWEELGPVSDTSQSADKSCVYTKVSLSDEEFTDSDEEVYSDSDASKTQPKKGEEDSSLMQILDSWYGDKNHDLAADGMVDCSRSKPENTSDIKLAGYPVRPPKRYSFVAESGHDKDQLVDNILGTLKKAGDSRLQN